MKLTMEQKRKVDVSYSRLASWASCPYRWDLTYNRGISRRKTDRAPQLGTAVHVGMASAMLREDYVKAMRDWAQDYLDKTLIDCGELDIEQLNSEIEDQVMEVVETAIVIVKRTLKYFNPDLWEVQCYKGQPLVEYELSRPVMMYRNFRGFVDLVAKEKATGQVWLIDYKVRKQLQSTASEESNLQMALYQEILRWNGIPTVGSLTLQILGKPNSEPKVNKDGSLSRARIATDWESYKDAIVANGLDPADYEDMKEKLDTEFVRESRAYRTNLETRRVWDEIALPIIYLMSAERHIYRHMSPFGCTNCWAKEFCLEELRGRDVSHLLETEFIQKEEGWNVPSSE